MRLPNWKVALARASLDAAERETYRRAILTFLKYCKDQHAPASVPVFRQYRSSSRHIGQQ
ncbi:MAG: hypothetical protein ACHQ4G_09740 [Opitutales bacterium]